jgi:hypothetical protein
MPAGETSHLISRQDAREWLAGSAVTVLLTHCTDVASAQSIFEGGVDIERSRPDAGWGQGFYSATIPDLRFGPATVRVAVRLMRPLVVRDTIDAAELLERLLEQADVDDVRIALLNAGYDGVVVDFGGGDLEVVAYHNSQVKVVVERQLE